MAITYREVTLPLAKHSDETTDRAEKMIAFPAVDGTFVMHFGKRQKMFRVDGRIIDFAGTFTKATIEGWNDTDIGTLSIHGTSYTNVRMVKCSFGEAYKDAVTNKMCCTYSIEFRKVR